MREICLKYDNMHIFGIINAFNYINNRIINVKIACYHKCNFIKIDKFIKLNSEGKLL